MKDTLQRFLFEDAAIRGDLVHLDATWQAVLERHDYPEPVRNLLGEMMVAAVLLSATLKLKGRLTIQIQGEGPVSLMVVECTSDRTLRGLAHADDSLTHGDLPNLVGQGRLAITLEPEEGLERYQSIVELTGHTLADALEHYLDSSEQLETRLWLSVDAQRAGGLLIQKLPQGGIETDVDAWNRIEKLSATIQPAELLGLSAREIIHRLYHEEDVRVFETEPVCFRCTCSRDRVANMLRTLGSAEVRSIIHDEGSVRVACEFCNHKYEFDAVDSEQLFATDIAHEAPTSKH
jgi:molecular chaperone Hsp33